MSKKQISLAGTLGFILLQICLTTACQAPLVQQVSTTSVRIELNSLMPKVLPDSGINLASASASRFLTTDAANILLSISAEPGASEYYFQATIPVSLSAEGKPSATARATNIPIGKAVWIQASVRDTTGNVILLAERSMTFSTESNTTSAALTLVPTEICPGVLALGDDAGTMSLAAGQSAAILTNVSANQVGKILRFSWSQTTTALGIILHNESSDIIPSTAILEGRSGAIFTPSVSGKIITIVTNPSTEAVTLSNIALKENLTSLTVGLDETLANKLVFTKSDGSALAATSLNLGEVLTITCANPANLSNWVWRVDGILDPLQTGPVFEWITTGKNLGSYRIEVSVLYGNILYTGGFTLTLNASASAGYTVTYSSGSADSGTVPVDTNVYLGQSSTVTVSGNTGNLGRSGWVWLGWTLNPDGSGDILGPNSIFTLSTGNAILYPKWLEMNYVPGGTYQRDSTYQSTVSGFYAGITEVSQQLYSYITSTVPFSYNAGLDANKYPANNISWYEALAFCNRLSLYSGLDPVYSINGSTDPDSPAWGAIPSMGSDQYWNAALADNNANGFRLPTRSEWAWIFGGANLSARATDMVAGINTGGYTKAYSGSTEAANGTANTAQYAQYARATLSPMKEKLPNELLLYDFSGGVAEWVWDGNANIPSGSRYDYSTRAGTNNLAFGGSWSEVVSTLGLAPGLRNAYGRYTSTGLRLVRKATGTQYIPRSGLVGEWLFDGPSLTNDSSGRGVVASASTGSVSTDTRTVTGNSYSMSAGQYLTFIDSTLHPGGNNSFSISLWFKLSSAASALEYLVYGSGAYPGLNYGIVGGVISSSMGSAGGQISQPGYGIASTGTAQFTLDAWHHAVLVYNGSSHTIVVYFDGLTTASGNASAAAGLNGPSDIHSQINGKIDSWRIYNRALSAAEVSLLYQE